jgi:hypothetical protein
MGRAVIGVLHLRQLRDYRVNSLSDLNAIAHINPEPNSHSIAIAIHLTDRHSNPIAYLVANANRYCHTPADFHTYAYAYCYSHAHGSSRCHTHSERHCDSRSVRVTYGNTFTRSYSNCNPTTERNAKPDNNAPRLRHRNPRLLQRRPLLHFHLQLQRKLQPRAQQRRRPESTVNDGSHSLTSTASPSSSQDASVSDLSGERRMDGA